MVVCFSGGVFVVVVCFSGGVFQWWCVSVVVCL